MHFHLSDLNQLLACIKNNSLRHFNVKQKEFEIIVNRETLKDTNSELQILNSTKSLKINNKKNFITKEKSSKVTINNHKKNQATEYFIIVSPMVGTFYRSPSPNEPYFINLNDHIQINQTVCIIEAMKLMNEIKAEINGNVVEFLVKDGDIVDCGQALIKLKTTK